jgi:3-hydroxyisobutyrate dehydrogenase-like beta-hydroxyacid dehydrogenase
MPLNLIGIGGLGVMLSPSARHLKTPQGGARYLRMFDRGARDSRRDACRESWRKHGAALVSTYDELIGDGHFDGVVICAGKNGDDFHIIRELAPLLKARCSKLPFILHLSTLSAGFVAAAYQFCASNGIVYGNYPLTGGPAGAEAATMLILASGDAKLYPKVEPMLRAIGAPRYFGENPTAGAEVKLIGHYMVFNGLAGITSAAALHAGCFGGEISGEAPTAFFDFLNSGAGGNRQWEVALKKGVQNGIWDQGFKIQHAVVDAIYAAQLGADKHLPLFAILPMIHLALALAFLLQKYPGQPLATHAITREFIGSNKAEFDEFFRKHHRFPDIEACIQSCIAALPGEIRQSVMLNIRKEDFER